MKEEGAMSEKKESLHVETHQMACGDCSCNQKQRKINSGGGNAVYSLGMIGALIYYLSTASGFWVGVLGVLKAIVWPAFVIFELMKYLHL